MCDYDGPSRSQLKREAESMQKLGEDLLALKPGELAMLDLPENLLEALQLAYGIKSHAALKRQRQLIGKIIRSLEGEPVDGEAIKLQLGHLNQSSDAYLRIERWVETMVTKLVAGDETAFAEISATLFEVDYQHLRQLVRNMHKELKQSQNKSKSRTQLFRYLRESLQQHLVKDHAQALNSEDES